ncbi:hypothetical protein RHSIM_Rhsim06G0228600 [Rhododendron simsii]|uniref:BURP domain-containing protein n=1 Tax=Rhododendron simsii TaxID=118357 RepID=A0A834GWY1_RHOSS|nr:hypothetical protein RHSIM_Rhsim06G0228600 [Rhododendron simsii]
MSKIPEMRKIYQAGENSTMANMLVAAMTNCERAPSAGEKKRCVGCVEDMMDFAISILGCNLTVLTTLNDEGSENNIMTGKVRAINDGKAVSCHQIMFPYLLYYCHSVPETDPESRVGRVDRQRSRRTGVGKLSRLGHWRVLKKVSDSTAVSGEALLRRNQGLGRSLEIWIFQYRTSDTFELAAAPTYVQRLK